MSTSSDKFPVINWVTLDGNFIDYRPAIGPDGQKVIFERTYNKKLQLYIVQDLQGSDPRPFLPDLSFPQTRPDWDWASDIIAFNISKENINSLYTVNADGSNFKEVPDTKYYIYPQWASQIPGKGNGFVVMNNSKSAAPQSTLIDGTGTIIAHNMNGAGLFGGMPAVFPDQSMLIAFAGQPAIAGWGGNSGIGYNQDSNYIFLNDKSNGVFTSSPMEPLASVTEFDSRFQGRAPAVSPDGKFIAFESNRNGGYALYLFNLSVSGSIAVRLTDSSAAPNAQHPKFSPDGKRLIFCATNPEKNQSRIAWIDITEYL